MNYIFACTDSNCYHDLLYQFLPSLKRDAKFDGRIVVFEYGLNKYQIDELQKQDCEVVICEPTRDIIIPVLRLRDGAAYIASHCAVEDRVMQIDGGDVFFQASLDRLFTRNELVAATEMRPARLIECNAMLSWAPESDFANEIISKHGDKPAVNGGMIYGPAGEILAYLNEAWLECTQGCFANFQGADQWYLSYACYEQFFPFSYIGNNEWNYTLCCLTLGEMVRNGRVYDFAGRLVPVVHKDGRSYPDLRWT